MVGEACVEEVLGTGSTIGRVAVIGIVPIGAFTGADILHRIMLHHTTWNHITRNQTVTTPYWTHIQVSGFAPAIFTDVEILSTAWTSAGSSASDTRSAHTQRPGPLSLREFSVLSFSWYSAGLG